jgi:hypothetical protein
MSVITKWVFRIFLFGLFLRPIAVSAMAISPSSTDVNLTAGEPQSAVFFVANDHEQPIIVHFDVVQAIFTGNEGSPQFQELTDPYLSWLSVDPSIATIEPGQNVPVTMTIQPPTGTTQTIIVGLRAVSDAVESGEVAIREGVVGLAFVTIGDPGAAGGRLADFQLSSRHFWEREAIFYTTLTNFGSTILKPTGVISLQNAFGQQSDVLEINPDGKRLAPGQTRTYTTVWQPRWPLGYYHATINLDSTSSITGRDDLTFLICSWSILVICPLLIGLVLILVRFVWRKKA